MTERVAPCPNCGAQIAFRWASAVQTTCPYCHSILVRHDVDLEKVGTVGDLPPDPSPIQLGTEGTYRGRAFTVVGRILYEYERGGWNEWHVIFADGASGWLSDAQAEYAVSFQARPSAPLPEPHALHPGSALAFAGVPYEVTTITRAHYRGVQGELPFEYWDKRDVIFADLKTADARFATIDYSDEPPLLYLGESVDVNALALRHLRDAAREGGAALAAGAVAGFNCPSCGAAIELRAPGQSVNVVCPSCHAVLDATDPNARILQRAQERMRIEPAIPLGTRGTWHGDPWEVIGFQVRTIHVDGTPYSWREYLLFHPVQGFRYLTEYDGHWNDVVALKGIAAVDHAGLGAALGPRGASYNGERFRLFQTAEAETTYILGEFPWQVRVGDRATVSDYVHPPKVLSSERTDEETTWSVGDYVAPERIWKAFGLKGAPPRPMGVYENQPNPALERARAMWGAFLPFFVVLVLALLARLATARSEEVWSGTYEAAPGATGDAGAFVSPVFTLGGHMSNVEVRTDADVDNDWIYLGLALINEQTGTAYDFGREVGYYHGVDSDGSWTEGSRRDRAIIPSVPPGRYFLRIAPETPAQPGARVNYTVTVRRDVPNVLFFGIALGLLLLPPAIASVRAASFEGQRWRESDTGSAFASAVRSDDED